MIKKIVKKLTKILKKVKSKDDILFPHQNSNDTPITPEQISDFLKEYDEKNFIASPNMATYNLVMDAHSALGNAAQVQDILLQMDATNGIINPNS